MKKSELKSIIKECIQELSEARTKYLDYIAKDMDSYQHLFDKYYNTPSVVMMPATPSRGTPSRMISVDPKKWKNNEFGKINKQYLDSDKPLR